MVQEKRWYHPGNAPVNKGERKMSSDNIGISIVREGREMMFGEIPFLKLISDRSKDDGGSQFRT